MCFRLPPKVSKIFKNVIRIIAFVLIVFAAAVLIFYTGKHNKSINKKYLYKGSIEQIAHGEVTFIRNDTTITAKNSGRFVQAVNEGDKVAQGSVIGYVVRSEYEGRLSELKSIEAKIVSAEEAASYIGSVKSPIVTEIESEIEQTILKLSEMSMSGDMSGYTELSAKLADLFAEKKALTDSGETTDQYLAELRARESQILNEISGFLSEVVADKSGIISFVLYDNLEVISGVYETILSNAGETDFNSISGATVTSDVLDEMSIAKVDSHSVSSVTAGDVVARISSEISYLITVRAPRDTIYRAYPKKTVTIRTSQSGDIEATTIGVFYTEDEEFLVARADSGLMNTVGLVKCDGEVVFGTVSGFKVPLVALTDWDRARITARLTVYRSAYVQYVQVDVLAREGEYAIVSARVSTDEDGIYLKVNDEYIVNYEIVTEGEVL